jgi:hypothetical protein
MGREALDRDGRELRIGKLQRQKVRVSRKRILESAHKVGGWVNGHVGSQLGSGGFLLRVWPAAPLSFLSLHLGEQLRL